MHELIPNWWSLTLIALGISRLVRLIGWDDLTITWRQQLTGLGDKQHGYWAHAIDAAREKGKDPWEQRYTYADLVEVNGERPPGTEPVYGNQRFNNRISPPVGKERFYFSKLIRCPWCLGFWVSVAWWLLWLFFPTAMVFVAVPFAYSELVGLVAKNLDK